MKYTINGNNIIIAYYEEESIVTTGKDTGYVHCNCNLKQLTVDNVYNLYYYHLL